MTDTEQRTPVLLLSSKTEHHSGSWPYLTFTLRAVYLTGAGEVRNYSTSSYDRQPLADLVLRAQHDGTDGNNAPYGWACQYSDVYSVDLRRAEDMAKLLRKVDRGLEKLRAEFGYPESFAQYVTQVAKVLGIKTYGYKRAGASACYDENDYRWTDADGLRYQINELVAEFAKSRERVAA